MKLYIKKKPDHKKTFHANANEDAQGVKVETDVPPVTCISSEDEIMDSGQPLPVSIFGSNRESKHLEYMAVSSRSPSNGSYLSKAGIEYHIDQTDEESSNELVISGGEDLKIASNQTSGQMGLTVTYSWPSIAGQMSMKTPSLASDHTEASTMKQYSTNCDSGYSELDSGSVGSENKCSNPIAEGSAVVFGCQSRKQQLTNTVLEKPTRDFLSSEPILEDLELLFCLDTFSEEEERYLQKVEDISISTDSMCSEASSVKTFFPNEKMKPTAPASSSYLNPIAPELQSEVLNITAKLQYHNVSKRYAEHLRQELMNSHNSEEGNYLSIKSIEKNHIYY